MLKECHDRLGIYVEDEYVDVFAAEVGLSGVGGLFGSGKWKSTSSGE